MTNYEKRILKQGTKYFIFMACYLYTSHKLSKLELPTKIAIPIAGVLMLMGTLGLFSILDQIKDAVDEKKLHEYALRELSSGDHHCPDEVVADDSLTPGN